MFKEAMSALKKVFEESEVQIPSEVKPDGKIEDQVDEKSENKSINFSDALRKRIPRG